MGYLTDNKGNKSSMRFNTRLVVIAVFIILLAVAFYIIYSGIKSQAIVESTWVGMAAFCVGVATIVTGQSFVQQKQKGLELNTEVKEKEIDKQPINTP